MLRNKNLIAGLILAQCRRRSTSIEQRLDQRRGYVS